MDRLGGSPTSGSLTDDAQAHGGGHRRYPISRLELDVDVLKVGLHSARAHDQLGGDFARGTPPRRQLQHLLLAPAQSRQRSTTGGDERWADLAQRNQVAAGSKAPVGSVLHLRLGAVGAQDEPATLDLSLPLERGPEALD